jgi:hypothetical protein
MSNTAPMNPKPFAWVTAVARAEFANPPIGAFAMKGVVVQG